MAEYIIGKNAKLSFPTLEKPVDIDPRLPDVIYPDGTTMDFKTCPRKYSFTGRIEKGPGLNKFRKTFAMMAVRHKATGRTAIAIRISRGLMLVQFNNIAAMGELSSGWHLYPRHHFKRRRRK